LLLPRRMPSAVTRIIQSDTASHTEADAILSPSLPSGFPRPRT